MALASQLASWRDLSPALDGALLDTASVETADPEPGLGETPVVVAGAEQAVDLGANAPPAPGDAGPDLPGGLPDASPPVMPEAADAPTGLSPAAPESDAPEIALLAPADAPEAGRAPTVSAPASDALPELSSAPPVPQSPLAPGQDEAPGAPALPDGDPGPVTAPEERADPPVTLADTAPAGAARPADSAPTLPDVPSAPEAPRMTEAEAPAAPDAVADTPPEAPAAVTQDTQIASAPTRAEPPAPDAPQPEPVAVTEAAPAPPEPAPAPDVATLVEAAPEAPDAETSPAAPETPEAPRPASASLAEAAPSAPESAPAPEPAPGQVADALPAAPSPEPPATSPAVADVARPTPETLPQIVAQADIDTGPDTTPAPAPEPEPEAEPSEPPTVTSRLPGSALPGAPVRRLPRIGDSVEEGTPEPAAAPADAGPDVPALERYRVAFDDAGDGAPLAVVLIHGPGATLTPDDLGGVSAPVTIAVPAGLPEAGRLIEGYRDAGAEIVLIPDLPPRPRAQDVEVSLAIALTTLPGAVALMDLGTDGFQADRGATAAVLAAAKGSGHGVITYAQGFNSAQRAAEREDVPAALVERELDEGPAFGRGMDQAAFKARQQGGAVAVATATASVVAALEDWAADAEGSGVVLAPVSRVLTAD